MDQIVGREVRGRLYLPASATRRAYYKPTRKEYRIAVEAARDAASRDPRNMSALLWLTTGSEYLGTARPRTAEDEERDRKLGPLIGKRVIKKAT